jgi:hypothetical protein
LLTLLGFFVPRLYIGEGALSGGCQGLLTPRSHGQGLGCATLVWGQALAPLRLPFGPRPLSGKNKTLGTCFVQFREYFEIGGPGVSLTHIKTPCSHKIPNLFHITSIHKQKITISTQIRSAMLKAYPMSAWFC